MVKSSKSVLRAQGRIRKLSPVAIIDIGSNSVRLVVYEGLSRSPTPLYNEKILCGLGAHIASTGRLDDVAVERALATLRRFRMLAEQAGATQIRTLATAAAREAANGPEFTRRASEVLGAPIHVLTGIEEAMYAAYGIQCGFIDPQGVVADMGGGSVELTRIQGAPTGEGITLPLGGLRLQDQSGSDVIAARKFVRESLKGVKVLQQSKGSTFYAVGGTWRSMGRLHMTRAKYPLTVMHHYEISAKEARKLCSRLTSKNPSAMRGMDAVSSNRRALMPFGAVLLSEIMAVMKPERIVFSGLGVREGYLYSLLPPKVQALDPLLIAAEEFAVLRARSPLHARELVKWTDAAFKAFDIDETKQEKRYRRAACLLADITWRSHPDYRGDQALNLISNADFVGVDHAGRAYLALASYYRHEGLLEEEFSPDLITIISKRKRFRAKLLGALFRIAFQFSTAMPGVLPHVGFRSESDGTISLTVTPEVADFEGERLYRRMKGLAMVLDRPVEWAELAD
ncbi:MAG: exopolyphosphatase [Rhizobiaceae bacterium]|nr:exopolyphosphatase [Hyphomicrobiales bacterium]NRB29424.1 exopolyphosphatase [Rhizobiaceae bacterium]